MGWSIGYDGTWQRDIGYGVPAVCDHPLCNKVIDRGLSYVCGGEPYGGDCCGLYFCYAHLRLGRGAQKCTRCFHRKPPYAAKPDVAEWVRWKLTDESWQRWREENQSEVAQLAASLVGAVDPHAETSGTPTTRERI